jgi:hypothetical protein
MASALEMPDQEAKGATVTNRSTSRAAEATMHNARLPRYQQEGRDHLL